MKVQNTEENLDKCLCPQCPSYNDCLKDGSLALFCSTGKTECGIDKKGCVCGGCPVTMENGLTGGYWCINGAAE